MVDDSIGMKTLEEMSLDIQLALAVTENPITHFRVF